MSTQRDATAPQDRERRHDWGRCLVAEAFGTFALVFVAVGGDAMAESSGGLIGTAARAVAPALMVAALIYSIGDRSGAHFNPIVTLAFALKRLVPASWLLPYWTAQFAGAITASLLVAVMFGDHVRRGSPRPPSPPARQSSWRLS